MARAFAMGVEADLAFEIACRRFKLDRDAALYAPLLSVALAQATAGGGRAPLQ